MVCQATHNDIDELSRLALALWQDNDPDELTDEIRDILSDGDAAYFIAREGGESVGFAQCQLRYDYVEGTSTSPVGYLEGVYVISRHRGCGVGRALVAACEAWAKARGATEFASDCELHNEASLRFHIRLGFEEANRVICFRKEL